MTHLWQAEHGKPSRRGYHNIEWIEKMESLGLELCSHDEKSKSGSGQKVHQRVIDGGRFDLNCRELLQTEKLLVNINTDLAQKLCKIDTPQEDYLNIQAIKTRNSIAYDVDSINILLSSPFEQIFGLVKPPRKTSVKFRRLKSKYTCPECKTNVWGKPDMSLLCGICHSNYEQNTNI